MLSPTQTSVKIPPREHLAEYRIGERETNLRIAAAIESTAARWRNALRDDAKATASIEQGVLNSLTDLLKPNNYSVSVSHLRIVRALDVAEHRNDAALRNRPKGIAAGL